MSALYFMQKHIGALARAGKFLFIFLLVISWIFSGWPQVFNFPSKIKEAYAVTALTTYETNTAATTLTTTNQLTNSAPASEVSNITIKVGTKTGWDTLPSQGSTSNWAGGASEPAQLGTGFLWDVTTLEGNQIVSGNWTPKVKISVSNGSVVADIHVRVAVRSSAGVFTNIIDAASTGQTINTTATVYTLPATAGALTNFNTGDKIYQDVILNITTNSTGKATATFTEYENGGANESVLTPGYQLTPVSQSISFSLGASSLALGTLSTTAATTGSHTLTVATNATNGINVTYSGTTLTNGSNTITAMSTATTSSTGTSQFGINAVANTSPSVGAACFGTTPIAAAATGYATANNFKFVSGDTIVSSTGPINSTSCTISYLANISAVTVAGSYSTTLTFVATGNF